MNIRRNMIFYITALMIVTVLLIGMASCGTGGGNMTPEQATETFGAEQFHIQLTAQAK